MSRESKDWRFQFIQYLLTGGVATVIHYVVMWLALSFQFVPALATTVGFTAGASARFLFSYLHVFEPGGNMIQTIPHFVFALFLQMLVNAGVLSLFLSTSFPVWPSQVLTTGMLIIFNFLAHKFWVFR